MYGRVVSNKGRSFFYPCERTVLVVQFSYFLSRGEFPLNNRQIAKSLLKDAGGRGIVRLRDVVKALKRREFLGVQHVPEATYRKILLKAIRSFWYPSRIGT